MRLRRAKFAILFLSLSLACAVPQLLAKKKTEKEKAGAGSTEQRRAIHALNRLTFGPRPGDVQRLVAMGVDQWIDLQLHPQKIDDSALAARLEPLRTIRMSTKEIAENFPDPQEINQVMNGRNPMPSDPARRAVYEVQLARLQNRKQLKEEAGKNAAYPSAPDKGGVTADGSAMKASTDSTEGATETPTAAAVDERMNGTAKGTPTGAMNPAGENDPDDKI
jgi:hypothetical protein